MSLVIALQNLDADSASNFILSCDSSLTYNKKIVFGGLHCWKGTGESLRDENTSFLHAGFMHIPSIS